MKPIRVIMYMLLVTLTTYLWVSGRSHAMSIPREPEEAAEKMVVEAVSQPMEEFAPSAEPISPSLEPQPGIESVAVKEPVLPLEERDDAMLFEIGAMAGSPFDQAILMPFD